MVLITRLRWSIKRWNLNPSSTPPFSTPQCRRNFTATRIAPILPRLWSRDTHIVIYMDGVNHLHWTLPQQLSKIALR
ncbi:hypothetical protein GBA52_010050 [Prunus armeniaca]|nr:hypothetical protein GBA52_010050 [Prunus armeniaca]